MQITDKMVEAAMAEMNKPAPTEPKESIMRRVVTAALSAADAEPVKWPNRCNESAVEALRYLSDHDRPIGGEQHYNRAHLLQIADEIERMASRPLYAAPPAVAVEALEWRLKPGTNDLVAESQVGTYGAGLIHHNFVAILRRVDNDQWHDVIIARGGLEVVKDAAQADYEARIRSALVSPDDTSPEPVVPEGWQFAFNQPVRKRSGSWWEGRVVGWYSTAQTQRGYCVEIYKPNGSFHIYPESALEAAAPKEASHE